jgi:hypothetical protein
VLKRKTAIKKIKAVDADSPVDEYKLRASKTAGKGEEITREQLVAAVLNLDKNLIEGEVYFKTALFMLGALYVGHDLGKLEKLTGVEREFIEPRADRLRRARIWVKDDKTACEWFEDGGGVAFWIDVAVAEGLMNRAPERRA